MRGLLLLFVIVLTTACGAGAPTAAGASVLASELPGGLHRCDGSGDMDSFLKKLATKDPSTYKKTKAEWEAVKKQGAIAAEAVYYTNGAASCGGAVGPAAAGGPVVLNYVFQFRDETSAHKAFQDQSIWGFSTGGLAVGGAAGTTTGEKTGLSPNSVSASIDIQKLAIYVALWQNKAFVLTLVTFNLPTDQARKAAVSENSRI